MPRAILIAAFAALLSGCHPGKPALKPAPTALPFGAAFETVQLSRGGCFGSCPVYEVEIKADGKVIFNGKEFVMHPGVHEGSISKEALALLSLAIQFADLRAMRPYYMDKQDGCKTSITDLPGLRVSVTQAGTTHSSMLDTGCLGLEAPGSRLRWLGDTIDEVAGTRRWTTRLPE